MAVLFLLTGPSAGARFDLDGEVILGRSPSCTIPLEDAKASRRHVRVLIEDGQARVSDLGSRNGTVVNGEKIEGEVVMLPGDRLQVGDTTVLFEPKTRAALTDRTASGELVARPVEELLPATGTDGGLYHAGAALLSATSEAMVLRRAAEELAHALDAERSAALLGGDQGLLTAAVVGAEKVDVPRELAKGALERKEASRQGGVVCAPVLASGGAPFGVLYAERPEAFGDGELKTITALGRLVGEAVASARARQLEGGSGGVVLVGASRQFRKTVEQARRAAASAEPVALVGEPGTGRRSMAEYIHARSPRALGPFVVVDCRKPPVVVEEQIFGRTSAPGVPPASSALLKADGGTLAVLQLEALPRQLSERLARLVTKQVAPARQGGEEPVDVRLIVTTQAPIEALVKRGEVDPELGKALGTAQIEALPLRERRPDVLQLFEHFALASARAHRRDPPGLSPEAKRLLADYAWPGNVEELKGVAERTALLYGGTDVPALRLPPEIQEGTTPGPRSLGEMIARLEKEAITQALREAKGKKIKAAALLGISRPTLDKKITDYQIVVEKRRA